MDKEKIIEGYILTDLSSGNFQDFITKIKMMNISPEELKSMQLFGDPQVSALLSELMATVAAGTPYDASVTKLFDYVKSITKSNFSVDDVAPESFETEAQSKIAQKKADEGGLSMIAMNQRIDELADVIVDMSNILETLADDYKIAVGHDEEMSDKVNAMQNNIGKMTWVLGKVIGGAAPVNMSEDEYFDDENFEEGGMPAGTGLADINPDACPECGDEAISQNEIAEAEAYQEGIKDGMEAALNASDCIDDFSDEDLAEFSDLLDYSDEDEEYSDEDEEFSDEEIAAALEEFSDEELEQLSQLFSDEEEFDDEFDDGGDKSKAWYDGYNTAEKDEYKGEGENPVRPEELASKFGYDKDTPEYGDFVAGYNDAIAKKSADKPAEEAPAEEAKDAEPQEPKDKVEETAAPAPDAPDKPNDAPEVNNCNYSFSFGDTDPKDRYNSLKEYFSKND